MLFLEHYICRHYKSVNITRDMRRWYFYLVSFTYRHTRIVAYVLIHYIPIGRIRFVRFCLAAYISVLFNHCQIAVYLCSIGTNNNGVHIWERCFLL